MNRIVKILIMAIVAAVVFPAASRAETALVASTRTEVTLRVTLHDIKKKNLIPLATKEAIDRLLFRGIEGTAFNKPLCGYEESSVIAAHKDYFKNLYESRAASFVNVVVSPVSGQKDSSGRKAYIADVKINAKALREDLEAQKIIRKFGL